MRLKQNKKVLYQDFLNAITMLYNRKRTDSKVLLCTSVLISLTRRTSAQCRYLINLDNKKIIGTIYLPDELHTTRKIWHSELRPLKENQNNTYEQWTLRPQQEHRNKTSSAWNETTRTRYISSDIFSVHQVDVCYDILLINTLKTEKSKHQYKIKSERYL